MFFLNKKIEMPKREMTLPGRSEAITTAECHHVLGTSLQGPFPANSEGVIFGMGCFWGAERKFWNMPGVLVTAVGYAGGFTPNPTYQEVCSGRTGHNEVVLVVYDPTVVLFEALLKVFWEGHDPTQGMRQGNDVGTQYRSGIYVMTPAQRETAQVSKTAYENALQARGYGRISAEILHAPEFYYAEDYHQQYLAKNPSGYCGLGGTGVDCPEGVKLAGE